MSQLAQAGDTECTLTYVMRFPAYGNTESGGTHIEFDGQAFSIGIWSNWLRPNVNGGWQNWMDNGTEICTGLITVAVITARVSVATPTDGNRYFTFNINSRAKRGPYAKVGVMTMTPSSSLTIRGESRRIALLHEVIYFRGALSDDDVNTMHTLLQQQYIAA
ncbi:hypothetical protein EKD04_009685 [Chloroflexales bacterium ZM16-3]|nr:hypothetical protein [Chloroflexales bacterium ZM16-3]